MPSYHEVNGVPTNRHVNAPYQIMAQQEEHFETIDKNMNNKRQKITREDRIMTQEQLMKVKIKYLEDRLNIITMEKSIGHNI